MISIEDRILTNNHAYKQYLKFDTGSFKACYNKTVIIPMWIRILTII